MSEILQLLDLPFIQEMINNKSYLLVLGFFFFLIGFLIGSFFQKNPEAVIIDNNSISEEEINDYIEEIVENETSPASKKTTFKEINPDNAPRVLIAEDNLVNAKILIRLLTKYGIDDYTHVLNGELAFEARKENDDFDIILMDINMPKMTGDEATQAIIKWEHSNGKHHIPIIAVTANALKGDREKYLDAGMDDYTTKPIKFEKVSEIIKKHTGYKGV